MSQHVMDDLHQRIQQLKKVVLLTKQYLHLAKEEITRERDELLALKGHMMRLSKTLDALEQQMHMAMNLWQ